MPLLAPVAETLGIDLIWFGVILGINLQTSFLTPPFGFSLFYLRSITPAGKWKDQVTGKTVDGVKTLQIYKGVLPYIIIQFAAILVVIAFPGLVMRYKADAPTMNPNDVQIQIPGFGQGGGMSLPSLGSDGGNGSPNFGLPPLGAGSDNGAQAPAMGLPPLNFGGEQPAANPAPPPAFGLPPLNLGGEQPAPAPAAPAANPAPDLSQPPVIN